MWVHQDTQITNRVNSTKGFTVKCLDYRCCHPHVSYETSLRYHNLSLLSDRRKYFDQMFLFKIINGYIDSPPLLERIYLRVPRHGSRLRTLFSAPSYRTIYTSNNFFKRSVCTYNEELNELDIFNTSFNVHKSKIKQKYSQS